MEASERQGPRPVLKKVLLGIGLVAFAMTIGLGGYWIGHSTGSDLDAARAEGAVIGRERGIVSGTQQGYQEGLKRGRRKAFHDAYVTAFKKAYAGAFLTAGLEAPVKSEIEVSFK